MMQSSTVDFDEPFATRRRLRELEIEELPARLLPPRLVDRRRAVELEHVT